MKHLAGVAVAVSLAAAAAGCGGRSSSSTAAHHRYCAGLVAQVQSGDSESWYAARLPSPGGFPPCVIEGADGSWDAGPGSGLG